MSNPWAALTLICVARITMGLHFQSVASIAPLLGAELGITYAQIGLLIGLYMLPGTLLALPGGLISQRLGDKTVILGALALSTAGALLFANSHSLTVAVVGRLVSGAGGVVLNTLLTKVVTDWFAGRRIATAIGIMLSTFPLGIALALAALGALADATSWRVALDGTAAYSAVAFVLVLALYRDAPAGRSTIERGPLWRISRGELSLVLVLAVAWGLFNTGYVIFVAFTPKLLIERGYSLAVAGFIASWGSWVPIASGPLAGYVTDRARRPLLLITVGVVLTSVTCFGFTWGGPPVLWVVFFGVLAAAGTGIVALTGAALRPESRSTGFGVYYTIFYLSMIVVPPVAGWLLDVAGTAVASLWFAGFLWLLIVPTLAVFRWQRASVVQG